MHTFNYIHSYIFSCVNMIWTYLNPGHLRWYLPSQNWSLGQTAGASCSCKFITRQVPHGFAFSRYLYSRLCKITSHGHRTDQDSLETSWSMLVTQLRIWATSLSMPTTAPWLRFFFWSFSFADPSQCSTGVVSTRGRRSRNEFFIHVIQGSART